MTLSSAVVRQELEVFGCVKFEATLHGFEFLAYASREDGMPGAGPLVTWRLTHGGGISGESDRVWWLEQKTGQDKSEKVTTRRGLRRILREWSVDEPRPSLEHVAKRVENRYGTHFVWTKKPRRGVKP